MGLILLYLFIALGISFVCSIMEAVLLSTPMSFISIKVNEGDKSAKLLMELKTNIDKPISAILSLNTVAHTIGAAGVGAEAVKVFGETYFGVISAILTILILIVSEIIPKTIGANYWRALSLRSARLIQWMIYICYPLVWMSEFITKVISPKNSEAAFSKAELSAMVDAGAKDGVLNMKENRVIQNLIKLEGVKVRDVMTPHSVTGTANEGDTVKDFYANKALHPYSRIPLYTVEKDYICGYVLFKDVLDKLTNDMFNVTLSEIKRSIMVVSELESVSSTWEKLLENKEHIALVVNEYGAFEGIITMEDVVETILGLEIIDETDTVVDMQQLARGKWEERMEIGRAHV